ncbi:Myxococcus cysteine-rich repeat-containing protein [Nannocystis exedens]|uniref:Myxococcus cysteine-rich repeat-containing protein n=1 Tax=Nannocystis exedens TaxID=54 RepID=A0A1I2AE27_9BACT|nr:hypothetical protein [Nannocystis exedens]PCC69792.1 hypothetical protein NAEX_02818 [Nannocystis exedens]SFE42264.1 Myxococcus cysteine-rich repeat-containing protein [Nannocystis exedens]
MLPSVPRLGVALPLLLLPGCFNPTGAGSTGSTGPTTSDAGETSTDPTSTSTSTGTTTPPTTLPSQTDPTTEPVTSTDPITSTAPPPPGCGDGNVDDGEECDDGNTDNSDNCLDSCTNAVCGDGFVHAKSETCDAGPDNADDASCTLECRPAACGDELICPTCGEQCDGGTDCNDDCTFKQRYVFVTSDLVQGSLVGGLSGADELCAQAAGLNDLLIGRKFVAWLSTSTVSAADRLDEASVPYMRLDGVVVANDYTDLLDIVSEMQAPIDVDENGQTVADTPIAWTGTQADGLKSNASEMCEDWLTGLGNGRKGTITATGVTWTDDGTIPCNNVARLYCVQTTL